MTSESVRKVDQNGLKTAQAATIILLLLGFVFNWWVLVAVVAVAQFLGAFDASFAPYRLLYHRVIKPLGLVQPKMITDNPEPHRFAMLVGAIFNGIATLALWAGVPVVAWVLVWIVIVLANLNFWLNFCLGCLIYYQLNRLGVPGFKYARIEQQ